MIQQYGIENEMALLAWVQSALFGRGKILHLSGVPGSGKTALVEALHEILLPYFKSFMADSYSPADQQALARSQTGMFCDANIYPSSAATAQMIKEYETGRPKASIITTYGQAWPTELEPYTYHVQLPFVAAPSTGDEVREYVCAIIVEVLNRAESGEIPKFDLQALIGRYVAAQIAESLAFLNSLPQYANEAMQMAMISILSHHGYSVQRKENDQESA